MFKLISKIFILSIIVISCNLFSDEVHLNEGQLAPDFTLFDQEVSWREEANKNLLPELIKYNEVIKDNIGLRLQSRLTKEQAKFVARCNSVHRDISLNF